MYQSFRLLRLIFLVIFAVLCVGLWGYQLLYAMPRKACEAHGDWWDWHDRACGIPMSVTTFTHRPVQPAAKPGSH